MSNELFKNNLNAYSLWWNETQRTISVAIFDDHDVLIKQMMLPSNDYIIVPPNTTLKLLS